MNYTKARAQALAVIGAVAETSGSIDEQIAKLQGVRSIGIVMEDKDREYLQKHTLDLELVDLHIKHLEATVSK